MSRPSEEPRPPSPPDVSKGRRKQATDKVEDIAAEARSRSAKVPNRVPRKSRLDVTDNDAVTVVNFVVDRKTIDERNSTIIGEELFDLVDGQGKRKVLLDFSNVEYVSSVGFAKLITLHVKLQNVGGKLVLCGINSEISEVIETARLNTIFDVQKDEQAALAALGACSGQVRS